MPAGIATISFNGSSGSGTLGLRCPVCGHKHDFKDTQEVRMVFDCNHCRCTSEIFCNQMNKKQEEEMFDPTSENKDLENRFTYHPPKEGQPRKYEVIRDKAKQLAYLISGECPPSRELSLALTHLEEVVFWANAAIARNG